ncbi:MAG: response regulator transcription factor [Candidatus Omnitrophota bacterium]|nr:response regulator transcription factor [Candidatus Omnitrophota bacterium]
MRILVVEDDARVASFIRRGLREQNYAVDVAGDGEHALFLAQTEEYDLIILDWVLPKRTGLEVLRTLRADRVAVPILILTAKDQLQDKVDGLDAGADDYLTKPFRFHELLARVRALLRRRGDLLQTVLRVADLELDTLRHKVHRKGKPCALSSREFSLLEFLMRHANELVTRTMLAEHVWERDFDPMSNVIDVHVARLRQKIEDAPPTLLQTIHGRGYMLHAPEAAKASSPSTPAAPRHGRRPSRRAPAAARRSVR